IFFLILFLILGIDICLAQKKTVKPSKKKKESKNIFKEHKPSARDFHSIGHAFFSDLNLLPAYRYPADSITEFDTLPVFSRLKNYNAYHISYFFRYNLFQPDDEKIISLVMNPGFGIGLSQSKKINGFGVFNGSILLGYEWGAGSTYRSIEEKGFFIRAGVDYNYAPLITFSRIKPDNDPRYFIAPSVSFGSRKENDRGKLIETNIKIGMGLNKLNEEGVDNPFIFSRPISVRFSFVVFLDH
ncbi:MAG: hypothetical protein ACK452_00390, partial [Bacteroidota bacterium]